jgi:hypothetical protein
MAPHRQWCHTPEKGTHWYDGPSAAYAPLYRFVREQAALLDGYEAWAEVALLVPHRAWVADRERWLGMGEALDQAAVPYRIVVGGDEVVDRSVEGRDLAGLRVLASPEPGALRPADRAAVDASGARVVATVEEAASLARRPAEVEGGVPLRVLPRVGPGSAIVHVLALAYDEKTDSTPPVRDATLRVDLPALGVAGCRRARLVAPGRPAIEVPVEKGRVRLPEAGLWTLVHLASA